LLAITSGYIKQFDSLFDSWEEDNSLGPGTENFCQIFEDFDELVSEVVANSTAFTALTSVGTVYTWGDGRLYERLGRQVSSDR
jgi:alpha-tubulin suppressor-like RCC1 family protein